VSDAVLSEPNSTDQSGYFAYLNADGVQLSGPACSISAPEPTRAVELSTTVSAALLSR